MAPADSTLTTCAGRASLTHLTATPRSSDTHGFFVCPSRHLGKTRGRLAATLPSSNAPSAADCSPPSQTPREGELLESPGRANY